MDGDADSAQEAADLVAQRGGIAVAHRADITVEAECAGHGTLGATLGPSTGELLVREILGGTPQQLLAPFRLARFMNRS